MKKRIFALTLAFLLVFSACGAEQASDPAAEAEAAPAATEAAETAEAAPQIFDPQVQKIFEKMEAEQAHQKELDAIDESTPVDGVYQITSAAGVMNIAAHPEAAFTLLRDVDMNGAEWTPVDFTGTINGGDFTVSNFTVKETNGVCGFFATNSGMVNALHLKDVTMDCGNASTLTLGGFAAVNEGTIMASSVHGSAQIAANDGFLGGAVGVNKGSLMNVKGGVDMVIPKVSGTLYVGGFVGENKGVDLENCDGTSRLEVTSSDGARVGLFAGNAADCCLKDCRFSGEMNLLDGELFGTFCGEEANVEKTGMLIRDNSNSDEFLPEKERELRQGCADRMYEQGSVEWTVDRQLIYVCSCGSYIHNKTFVPGITYHGIPYTHNYGNMTRFFYCFDEDGKLKDWVPSLGFDGFDMYIGNDCSGGVYWSWAPIDPEVTFKATNEQEPGLDFGCITKGDYEPLETQNTNEIVDANGTDVIMEAYTQLNMGDAVVTFYDLGEKHENHTKMCFANPVVYRDENGKIDPDASYFRTHEQGDGLYYFDTTSWYLNRENESFSNLLGRYYVPITCKSLATCSVPEVEVSITDTHEDKAHLLSGTVKSNYRLECVSVRITDENGGEVMNVSQFVSMSKYENVQSTVFARECTKEYEMSNFASALTKTEMEPGKTYHFESSVTITGGRTYPLKSFDFTY